MRTVPAAIWSLWDAGGPFIGDDAAPHSRVTVEPDWFLTTSMSAGNYPKLPVRWWQRADNSQTELEVPNIQSIEIERNIDTDAATATITLSNQWHFNNGVLTSSSSTPGTSYGAAVTRNNPELYWRFQDAGTSVTDTSGHAHTGTIVGGATVQTASLTADTNDTSISFSNNDASDNHVETAAWGAVSYSHWTLEAIVNFDDLRPSTSYEFICGFYGVGAGLTDVEISLSGIDLNFFWFDGTAYHQGNAGGQSTGPGFSPSVGQTYHIVVTYNGTDTRMYVNGSLVLTNTANPGASAPIENTTKFLAAGDNLPGDGFAGRIDEVAFYSHPLTATDVAAHYAALVGTPGGGTATANPEELGQPGYFTFSRGDSSEATARWGQTANAWNGILVPNALIRTYQGYGGKSKTAAQAITDGNILLTGVWLIDTVSIQTDGHIALQCRDMAKLLIDQFIFPPLTPSPGWYPLSYCRYTFISGSNPGVLYGHLASDGYLRVSIPYRASTGDDNGANTPQLGHRPTDALDQTTSTYWLSPGKTHPTDWIFYEVDCNDTINAYFTEGIYPGYQMYVSVMENGAWQGSGVVPAPSGYNINYVIQEGSDSGGATGSILDRAYAAQRVRFTFTNLRRTDLEGITYRVGFTEISAGRIASGLPTKKITSLATTPANNGYWLVGNDGGVFSKGDARFYGSSGGGGTTNQWNGIASMPDGTGYFTSREDGRVYPFGSAVFQGDAHTLSLAGPIQDIGITPTGAGYWLLGGDGGIFAFGDAAYHGNGTSYNGFATAIAERPQGDGYWILFHDGHVGAYGGATTHGDATSATTTTTGITSTVSGNGYWIVDENGAVYAFGDAHYRGGANTLTLNDKVTDITRSTTTAGDGYFLVAGDGGVFAFGDATFRGSLVANVSWQVRKDGNYKDYTDIIKDLLLWSGWWLNDPAFPASSPPEVYGNIETTGIFDNSLSTNATGSGIGCLPEDLFDKKPVIDAITQLKEIVGFNFWIDEEGGARFELPNWYTPGNRIMDDGSHTTFVPQVDEATNLIDYSLDYTDAPVRSEIIIASADPDSHLTDTITSRLEVSGMAPESTVLLRGMVKPAMWVNETFQNQQELDIMAKRVATQILFNQRTATVVCAFNPAIQINDQIEIFERQTSETYIHYVRGVHITHDLESGKIQMTLKTHWLGTGSTFIITSWGTP